MFSIAIVYESGKRYILPIDVLVKTFKLSDEDIKRLEMAVKKEVQKL
jgi:hypothetical protein